jgi:hypothetical protein
LQAVYVIDAGIGQGDSYRAEVRDEVSGDKSEDERDNGGQSGHGYFTARGRAYVMAITISGIGEAAHSLCSDAPVQPLGSFRRHKRVPSVYES